MIARLVSLARAVPGIAWVGVFAATTAIGGLTALYLHAEHAGAAKVVRAARRDSTAHAVVVRDSAMARTDRSVVVASRATDSANASRAAVRASAAAVQRRRQAAAVIAALDSTPAPVLQLVEDQAAQIARDSVQIALDSLALARSAAALDTAHQERGAHLAVDTARTHEALDPTPPDDGTSALDVAKDVSLVAVLIAAVVAVLSFFHR